MGHNQEVDAVEAVLPHEQDLRLDAGFATKLMFSY